MQRPYFVAVGGTEDQPLECRYCGAEGAAADEIFQAAADDGRNELVRLFAFPMPIKIAEPKRYGVPEAEPSETNASADSYPTTDDMLAAVARIEELSAMLRAERVRADQLEAALVKAVKPAKAAKPAEQAAAGDSQS